MGLRSRLPAALAVLAAATAARADDWPQWMGPTRDGVWREPGVVEAFPAAGPKKLWSAPVGLGYAGPAVADGKVYVPDYLKAGGDPTPSPAKLNKLTGRERLLCFDAANGTKLWEHAYDCPYLVAYPGGPRCTPTVSGGKVYSLGTMGDLFCLDAAKGTVVWSKNFPKDYAAKTPMWGFCGHPLVYKNLLLCTVGGDGTLLVAFDKDTGKEAWRALSGETPGYCPPTVVEVGGHPVLTLTTPAAVVGLDPATGAKRWDLPFKPNYAMSIAAPQVSGDLLLAAGYGDAVVAKLAPGGGEATEVWRAKRHTGLYPSNATPLIADGIVYGVDAHGGHLRAVKLATGERLWETTEPVTGRAGQTEVHGTAFLVRHEEKPGTGRRRYFVFNELGELLIAKLTAEGYESVSKAKLVEPTGCEFNRKVVWSHPAFADKCVFVRNDAEVACFSLAK